MPSLPTVKVVDPSGDDYLVINESDFNAAIHQLWGSKATTKYQERSKKTHIETKEIADTDTDADTGGEAADTISKRADELAETKTVAELRAIAKDLDIEGYRKLKQAELARAIAEAEATK